MIFTSSEIILGYLNNIFNQESIPIHFKDTVVDIMLFFYEWAQNFRDSCFFEQEASRKNKNGAHNIFA